MKPGLWAVCLQWSVVLIDADTGVEIRPERPDLVLRTASVGKLLLLRPPPG